MKEKQRPNPAEIYLSGLSTSPMRTMRTALDCVAGILAANIGDTYAAARTACSFPWATVRFEHVQTARSEIEARYRPSMANLRLTASRGVLKTTWRLGQMDIDAYLRAENAGRSITSAELRAILSTCDRSVIGVRDTAIISLVLSAFTCSTITQVQHS